MAATRLISIVGRKDAGKTTLLCALAAELDRRGKRVMTLKHGHHAGELDVPGTDSWRHRVEGRAARTLLAGPHGRLLFETAEDRYDPAALAREYLRGADIVLVEGYKRAAVPKIEVWRRGLADPPLHAEAGALAAWWRALVTDDPALRAGDLRVYRSTDTMWLQLLAQAAWDGAMELG